VAKKVRSGVHEAVLGIGIVRELAEKEALS